MNGELPISAFDNDAEYDALGIVHINSGWIDLRDSNNHTIGSLYMDGRALNLAHAQRIAELLNRYGWSDEAGP